MNVLIVGGNWDREGGKKSSLLEKFSASLKKVNETVCLYNGGNIEELFNIIDMTKEYDAVLWWANVSNDEVKIRNVKDINPKTLLVNSKRNDNGKYTFSELINRSLEQKANLTVEFSKRDDGYHMMLFDPLGTVWYEGNSIKMCALAMNNRLTYLKSITRCQSIQVGEKVLAPETDFYDYVKDCAEIFHELINPAKEVTRFLGNSSYRCQRGFPSFRDEDGIYVSRRNVDKRFIDRNSFVKTYLGDDKKTYYYGEDKPSVDTPVQLRLYKMFPNVNYMIHAHCYVDGGVYTENPVPCGAIEEGFEIFQVTSDFDKNSYAYNLIGHGCIIMGNTIDDLKQYKFIERAVPEKI